LDNDLRDKCIMTVGTPNRLTSMTAEFSRGTDFIISDKKIKNNGGLHLILTYVPELRSEFIQFRGRTGRQGQ
jgi:preprotein translocase subunit SecA